MIESTYLLTTHLPPARVGLQLVTARQRAGVTRRQLAGALGVTARQVRRWEQGDGGAIADATLRTAASVLEVEIEALVPRRQPVAYDEATSSLVLGIHIRPVDLAEGNRAVLAAYRQLVSAARSTAPATLADLRHDDLVVLATLLDLDDAALEAQLVEELNVSGTHASVLRTRLRAAMSGALRSFKHPSRPLWSQLAMLEDPDER